MTSYASACNCAAMSSVEPKNHAWRHVIEVSDHLASEFPSLMRHAQTGNLTFPESALRSVNLDAAQINAALGALESSTDHVRTVIVPGS